MHDSPPPFLYLGNVEKYRNESKIAHRLSEEEKREICRCMFLVASVDGDLGEQQQLMLQQLPSILGVSDDDFREIVAQAASE